MAYEDEMEIEEIEGFDEKLSRMLDFGFKDDITIDNNSLFERGDKVIRDTPIIDTEQKIKDMLGL